MWEGSTNSSIHSTSLLSVTLQAISHRSQSTSVVEQIYRLVRVFQMLIVHWQEEVICLYIIYVTVCVCYLYKMQVEFPNDHFWFHLNS